MKAQAVVFPEKNKVTFQEVECPDPGPGDVIVQVTHSWISNGTEGSYLRGERIEGDTPIFPGDPEPFPIAAGYQKIGMVDWVGSEVSDLQKGDLVFSSVGNINGMAEPRAGHISPNVSSRGAVMKLPEGVEPLAFSGLVLTQVGFNCGWRPPVEPGNVAVVVGDGLVGQWAGQMLASRGAKVILVGRHPDRMAYFQKGETLLEENGSWEAIIAERFPDGVQVGVDTVGSLAVMDSLQKRMSRYGHLVSAGFYGSDDAFHLQPPRYREISIDLVSGATADRLQMTMDLITDGTLETLPLITHHFPVAEAAKAWDLIQSKRETVLGVILDW